ncbi:MAG: MFS transporter [Bacillota bacterium]|nr:MFS transporter [Bacillota bacterium]
MQEETQKELEGNLQVGGKPPLWTINYILICMSSLTMFLALYSLIPTLPVYIDRFGGTTSAVGLALAALTVGSVISRPVAGWALDKYGRRIIFLGGLIFFLLPTVIYIWMVPVITLIVLRFFQGLGWGVGNTGSNTAASDIVPRERLGEGMGFFSVTLSISMAAAPALGLWLIAHYSFKTLFITCSLLTLASIVLAALVKYPQIKKQSTVPKLVFMEKSALRPAMVMLCVTIGYSSFLSFLSLHAMEQGLASAGLFFTSFAVTTLVSRPLSGIIVDRFGTKGYDLGILIGIFAAIAAVPVLAQTTSLLHLVAGGVLYGIGFGFIQPMMLTLAISSVSPEKKGAANATFWTGFDIGVAMGSITWGMVAAAMGYRFMFYLTIIPLVIALVVYFSRSHAKSPAVEQL